MHRSLLMFVGALVLASVSLPTASALTAAEAWWSTDDVCAPVTEELREGGITHDNNTTGDSRIEYDPLKAHSCAVLRDDLERAAYDLTGADEYGSWGCFYSSLVPWKTCVGVNLEGCDVWVSTLWWQCVGGVFPDNTPG